MPLVLYVADRSPRTVSLMRRLQIWLATQKDQNRYARCFFADRRHLLGLEPYLLDDVGLTREDVLSGVPLRYGVENRNCATLVLNSVEDVS